MSKKLDQRILLFSVTRKDFRVDTFRSGGKGGQNQNTRDTGVCITHLESGAVGESRNHRSQGQNKKEAFHRLLDTPQWKQWLNKRILLETQRKEIEEKVERMLKEETLVEYMEDGQWKS